MLRSRFFWKLYLTYVALVLVTSAIIGLLVNVQLQASLIDDVEGGLRRAALLMAPHAAEALQQRASGDIRHQVETLGRETETRITLVLPDGRVLADSEHAPESMENHGDRPEIVASRSQPFGVARRFSSTLQESLLYVSRAVRVNDRLVGFVRTSIPLSQVDTRLSALRRTIAFGAGVGILVALAAGLVVAQRITSPVAEMTAVAEALGQGEYDRRVESQPSDEIGVLGATLNRLADELTRRLATLAQERAQLGAMVAGIQEGVLAVDSEDRIVFSNEAVRRLLRASEAELDGRRLSELTRLSELSDLLAAAGQHGEPAREEIALHRNIGDIVLDARATLYEADGERGVVMVLYDITNLRRLEQIRTDFVANVSHELKTPLTSIGGYVETLLSGAIHDEEYNVRFLQRIDDQVARINNLVSDLLSLARIESHEEAILLSPIDWEPLVSAAVQRHAPAMARKHINHHVGVPAEPVVVLGDDEAMTQILDNLLDNAIKYTPEGGSVTMRLASSGPFGTMEVEDTGIGIREKHHERIFERFYRVDKARSRELGGTGLGLSIVKHLVRRLHGEISVESEVARGSRFTITLPLAS